MGLGVFARYDQPSIDASQRSQDDTTFVTLGLSLRHRFLPAPAVPVAAPVVAEAPPPPAPMKKKIILRGVNFDFDKATLRPDARPILDEAVRVLKEEPSIRVSVEGHTDAVGTDAYNQGLSQRRAATVRGYLVDHGIDAGRLSSVGFGESKPVASNDTADGRAQNRRVELLVQE
jgi:outer membrane protein OmpA-like peptidoglycan-associated protein